MSARVASIPAGRLTKELGPIPLVESPRVARGDIVLERDDRGQTRGAISSFDDLDEWVQQNLHLRVVVSD